MKHSNVITVAERFSDFFAKRNLQRISDQFADDIIVRHANGAKLNKTESLKEIAEFLDSTEEAHFEAVTHSAIDGLVLQSHLLFARFRDGRIVSELPVILIFRIRSQQITQLDDYAGSPPFQPFEAASSFPLDSSRHKYS